jgi:hypothetical protein
MNRPLTLTLGGLLLAGSALAQAPHGEYNLRQMGRDADLVFYGTVIDVDYRASEAALGERAVPHTFVTYRIEEIFSGKTPEKTITLRFLGGRGKEAEFLMIQGYPLFDIGDEDLLFVKGNGEYACPLIGCEEGRFRSIDGQMYNEEGRQLIVTQGGKLRPGKPVDLEAVNTHRVSRTLLRKRTFNEPGERLEEPARTEGLHLDKQGFLSRARNAVYQGQQDRSQPPGLTRSASREIPFKFKQPTVSAPGRDASVASQQGKGPVQSTRDMKELEAIRRNGGNPVID